MIISFVLEREILIMDSEFYRKRRPEIPVTRNVWLRLLNIFLIAFAVSYFLYWGMSGIDLASIEPHVNRRSSMAFVMLNIMPAAGWGWFSFLTIMVLALWGEWRDYHFQSYPKEKSPEEEK
jgi:amino acid transporter